MYLAKLAADVWRDFIDATLPRAGFWNPKKEDIRGWGTSMEGYMSSLIDGGAKAPIFTLPLPGAISSDMSNKIAVVNQAAGGSVTLPRTILVGTAITFAVIGAGAPTFITDGVSTLVNRSGHASAAGGGGCIVFILCHANPDGKSAAFTLAGDTAP